MKQKIIDFISSQVDMDRVNLAVKRMYYQRAPLSHVDPGLYDQITDLLEEYGEDNDLPEGWYLLDDIDPEDLIFELKSL